MKYKGKFLDFSDYEWNIMEHRDPKNSAKQWYMKYKAKQTYRDL
jgi:hypothetical protein